MTTKPTLEDQTGTPPDGPTPDPVPRQQLADLQTAFSVARKFAAKDLAVIVRDYETSRHVAARHPSPWVGYSYTTDGGALPTCVYLFTKSRRYDLCMDKDGKFQLFDQHANLLWSGHALPKIGTLLQLEWSGRPAAAYPTAAPPKRAGTARG